MLLKWLDHDFWMGCQGQQIQTNVNQLLPNKDYHGKYAFFMLNKEKSMFFQLNWRVKKEQC